MIVNRLKALSLLGMLAIGLAACANPSNPPSNAPLAEFSGQASDAKSGVRIGKTAVIVALSGGGARSAAFGYGVLSELAEQPAPEGQGRKLADDIAVLAGVSGGGILAAYVALHGTSAISAFKRDFLDQDPEASLRIAVTPANLLRGYRGGVNDLSGLSGWLDERLYRGATLGDLQSSAGPRLLLHATDLYNRAPFPFDPASFKAICSDFRAFPLSTRSRLRLPCRSCSRRSSWKTTIRPAPLETASRTQFRQSPASATCGPVMQRRPTCVISSCWTVAWSTIWRPAT